MPSEEALVEGGIPFPDDGHLPKLYRAVGCPVCGKTGYRGRTSVHEVMLMSEDIERLAAERKSSEDIKRVARDQGMKVLREDGIEKVLAGVTSIEEIFRVIV